MLILIPEEPTNECMTLLIYPLIFAVSNCFMIALLNPSLLKLH